MTARLPGKLASLLREPEFDVAVVCGLGGGGPALVRTLAAACTPEWRPADPDRSGDAAFDTYPWPGGVLIDMVGRAGHGPRPDRVPHLPDHSRRIVLVRDLRTGQRVGTRELVDLTADGTDARIFKELLAEECGLGAAAAEAVAERWGNATALIPDLATALERERAWNTEPDAVALCAELPLVVDLMHDLQELGTGPFDLGRVLCMFDPPVMELDEVWSTLASELSPRGYTVSDLSRFLLLAPGLVDLTRSGSRTLVSPASPLAATLLESFVPPSAAEHLRLYHALRDLSTRRVEDGLELQPGLRRQIPRQARRGQALHDLTEDMPALLCCDPKSLITELEGGPARLSGPGARAVLLSAHRLFEAVEPAGYLELAGSRMGPETFGRRPPSDLVRRPWRTEWAKSQMVHTHRVLMDRTSPILAVCTADGAAGRTADGAIGRLEDTFGGCSDGSLWNFDPMGRPRLLWRDPSRMAEIRAVAAARVGERTLVAAGTSDHAVMVVDRASGGLVWRDEDAHSDPLSVLAIGGPADSPVLFSAGVGGRIWAHSLDGPTAEGSPLYGHGSEIRGLAVAETRIGELLVFGAVDGTVGVVEAAGGRLLAVTSEFTEVLNAVDLLVDGAALTIFGGTSSGRVVRLGWRTSGATLTKTPEGAPAPLRVLPDLTSHGAAVNGVRVVPGSGGEEAALISCSSDHTWRWTLTGSTRSVAVSGHTGPIWSATAAAYAGRRYVVSSGGDGATCLWLVDQVLNEEIELKQHSWHVGGVSSIVAARDAGDRVAVVTGGRDGHVRAWRTDLVGDGAKLTAHAGEISALGCAFDEDRLRIVSGSLDGPLRLTEVAAGSAPTSVILGIAHEGVTALSLGRPDARWILVSGGLDGTLTVWDLDTRLPLDTVSACRYGAVSSLAFSADRSSGEFIVGGQDGTLALWDADSLEENRRSNVKASVLGICAIPGTRLGWVAGLSDGKIAVIRDLGSHAEQISYIPAHSGEVRTVVCFALGGRVIVGSAGVDRSLRVFDLETRTLLLEISLDGYATCAAQAAPFLAVGSSAGAALFELSPNLVNLRHTRSGAS